MDAGIASIDDTQTQGLKMSAFVRRSMVVSALLVGATLASSPALAQRKSAQDQRKEQMAQIPTCARPLGSISVLEPEDATNWWTGQQLPAPSKLIKVFVSKSRCFTLVDRGAGMNAAMRERELAAGGELRQRSNLGKGQIKAADYVLVPDLIGANSNAGGNAVGGLIGGLIGGNVGALVGGLNFKKKTADVVLTVTDVRSTEQVAMAEGNAKKTDIGWGASGGLFSGSGFGAAGAGGYANTELGQVITLAYLQAYTDIISQLGGISSLMGKPSNITLVYKSSRTTTLLLSQPFELGGKAAKTGGIDDQQGLARESLTHID